MGETRHPHPMQTASKVLAREERNREIIRLKRAGMSHAEVAAQVGCSKDTITDVHKAAIAEVRGEMFTDTALYAAEAVDRLDALLNAIWPRAMMGDDKAVAECRRLIAERGTWTGGKEPVKVELQESSVDAAIRELDAELARRTAEAAREADRVEDQAGRG